MGLHVISVISKDNMHSLVQKLLTTNLTTDDASSGDEIEHICHKNMSGILSNWLLLDNQSKMDLFVHLKYLALIVDKEESMADNNRNGLGISVLNWNKQEYDLMDKNIGDPR